MNRTWFNRCYGHLIDEPAPPDPRLRHLYECDNGPNKGKPGPCPDSNAQQQPHEFGKQATGDLDSWVHAYSGGDAGQPGTFGRAANEYGAKFGLQALQRGETDPEKIAEAVHNGWSAAVMAHKDKMPREEYQRRRSLIVHYDDLSEEEKDKDRVRAQRLIAKWRGASARSGRDFDLDPRSGNDFAL